MDTQALIRQFAKHLKLIGRLVVPVVGAQVLGDARVETLSHQPRYQHILKHPKLNCKCTARCTSLEWNKIRTCTLAKSYMSMILI